jgi:hypothetical protein
VTSARLRIVVGAALLAGTLAAARAEPPIPLPVRLAGAKGRVVATLDLAGAFDARREREFGNGLTNVVVIYTSVVPVGGGAPLTAHGRIVEILYDVWEETYAVTVNDPDHPARRVILPTFETLRAFLADQREVDLGPVDALPDSFVLDVRVEVNPISKEQLQKTREYIAAAAAGSRASGSRSVLGAVASFLLREPDAGSDAYLFRSEPFTRSAVMIAR